METVALYLRLSLEDKGDEESESIKNQRKLLLDFAEKTFPNTNIIEFSDDGYSGTNFNRPAIKSLLSKAKNGEIQCIIVKDFSRFGRNLVQVGDYIEQIFPFLGVRFIAVNNHFDSKDFIGSSANLDVAFKNLINDYYSKDISKKVKTAKQTKMKKGDYISAYAFFGYKKSEDSINKLVIDNAAAQIVARIFNLAISGFTTAEIARKLNFENILTPMQYKEKQNFKRRWNANTKENFWTRNSVLKIIRDERYTGKFIGGKREIVKAGSNKSQRIPTSEWIILPNNHEAIISENVFLQAQKAIASRPTNSKLKKSIYPLKGMVFCGVCKNAFRRKSSTTPYFFCETSSLAKTHCFCGRVYESYLEEIIVAALNKQIKLFCNLNKCTEMLEKKLKQEHDKIEKAKALLEASKSKKQQYKLELYEKYASGGIAKSLYITQKQALAEQIASIEKNINQLELEMLSNKFTLEQNSVIKAFKQGEIKALDATLVGALIEKIIVLDINKIEIVWKFKDEYTLLNTNVVDLICNS